MEPLQPSSRRKTKDERRKNGSNYSKRAENAKLSETVGATAQLEDLERQMKEAAARLDFEEAARLRDIIRGMK
jgi:excinuclease ABC subunit B